MRKLFYDAGYELIEGAGKGSHWKLRKRIKVMKYHFKTHKEGKGYWAECIELSGCITQADSMKELNSNMQEALNLYLEEPIDSNTVALLPDDSIKLTSAIVEVPVDPSVAFSFIVRYNRIKKGLTQKQAAKMLGFENIYSYQRLEGKNCNPSLKMISQIKKCFPDISIDFAIGY